MPDNRPILATAGPAAHASWASLFNPFSVFTDSIDRYPAFMNSVFGGNERAAWLASKSIALATLAAGITGLTVAIKRTADVYDTEDSNNPAKNLQSQLGTTYRVNLMDPTSSTRVDKQQKKKRKQARNDLTKTGVYRHPELFSFEGATNFAVPVAAAVLASASMYRFTNKQIDKTEDSIIDNANAHKSEAIRRLIATRARVARGLADDAEVQRAVDYATDDEAMLKSAAGEDNEPSIFGRFIRALWPGNWGGEGSNPGAARKLETSLGLVVAGLGVASTIAGYTYFSASDPDNIKYKAMKKGLRQYAVDRAINTPITISPIDDDKFFEAITTNNKNTPKEKRQRDDDRQWSARDLPEKQEAARPISVTF